MFVLPYTQGVTLITTPMTIDKDKILAQQYLNGELSPEQRALFEERLQREPKLQVILKRLEDRAKFGQWMREKLDQMPLPTEEEQEAAHREVEAAALLYENAEQKNHSLSNGHTKPQGGRPAANVRPLWQPVAGIAAAVVLLLAVWQLWPAVPAIAPTEVAELEVAVARGTEGGVKAKVVVVRYAQHPDYTFHYQWKGSLQDTLQLYGVTPPVKFLELRDERESGLIGYVVHIGDKDYLLTPTAAPLPLKSMY